MRSVCPLFEIRRLSAIREQKMYCVYGNSGYIHGGPLFGGGPLLGRFVIRGSTVQVSKTVWGPYYENQPTSGSGVKHELLVCS